MTSIKFEDTSFFRLATFCVLFDTIFKAQNLIHHLKKIIKYVSSIYIKIISQNEHDIYIESVSVIYLAHSHFADTIK